MQFGEYVALVCSLIVALSVLTSTHRQGDAKKNEETEKLKQMALTASYFVANVLMQQKVLSVDLDLMIVDECWEILDHLLAETLDESAVDNDAKRAENVLKRIENSETIDARFKMIIRIMHEEYAIEEQTCTRRSYNSENCRRSMHYPRSNYRSHLLKLFLHNKTKNYY